MSSSSPAPRIGARTSSSRNSKSLEPKKSSVSKLKKSDSDVSSSSGRASPARSSSGLVRKASTTKVKKEENQEESEFRKRLSAYRKNKNAHAPDLDLARPKSPRTNLSPRAASSPAVRRPSTTTPTRQGSTGKSPARRPSTGPAPRVNARPKASPMNITRKRAPSYDVEDDTAPPPAPEEDRQLAVAGYLHEQEPNFDMDGIQQTGLDVGKLTSMYDTINTRYGTKELKKRAFAVLIKQVTYHHHNLFTIDVLILQWIQFIYE
jgi:hypothetical protein